MAESPAPLCWDGMELGSRAALSVGRTFGCAASNLFWGGGGFFGCVFFFFFFFKYHYSFPGFFPKVQPGKKKMELEGGKGPFGPQPAANGCPAEAGLQHRPCSLPSPGDFGALHPPMPARLGLMAPWEPLPCEATATGRWGHGGRWQSHSRAWKRRQLCGPIYCLRPRSMAFAARTGLASSDRMSYFCGSRGWLRGRSSWGQRPINLSCPPGRAGHVVPMVGSCSRQSLALGWAGTCLSQADNSHFMAGSMSGSRQGWGAVRGVCLFPSPAARQSKSGFSPPG